MKMNDTPEGWHRHIKGGGLVQDTTTMFKSRIAKLQ